MKAPTEIFNVDFSLVDDYESDEFGVRLLSSDGENLGDFKWRQFNRSDFESLKQGKRFDPWTQEWK